MNGYYATPYSCQAYIENKSSRTTLLCNLTQVATIKFKNFKAESNGFVKMQPRTTSNFIFKLK